MMTQEQITFYQQLLVNDTVFDMWSSALDQEKDMHIGTVEIDSGAISAYKVKVKDASRTDLFPAWAQFCAASASNVKQK